MGHTFFVNEGRIFGPGAIASLGMSIALDLNVNLKLKAEG